MVYDLAIVGGGIAGYTAALAAKNLKLNALWLGERAFGEKVEKAEHVRNFPAFQGTGRELLAALEAQRESEGVLLTQKRIDGVYLTGGHYTLTAGEEQFFATCVILATGVQTNAVAGAEQFLGRGVSYCAVCDGALYRGKEIAVGTYSQKFAHEVEYLASFARRVHCFCPVPLSFEAENIVFHQTIIKSVSGGMRVERVESAEGALPVDGVFFLLESAPPKALVGGLKTEGERVTVGRGLSTNLKGLFAAGDVTGRPYQYVKAAGEGLAAAYSAYEYLKQGKKA